MNKIGFKIIEDILPGTIMFDHPRGGRVPRMPPGWTVDVSVDLELLAQSWASSGYPYMIASIPSLLVQRLCSSILQAALRS